MAVNVNRSIQLKRRTVGGDTVLQNISNVNPAASATVLKGFCQGAMALTTDTYIDGKIIDEESINEAAADEEEGGE